MNFLARALAMILFLLPAFVFWIWLMKEAVRTWQQCPEKCWCSAADAVVDCSNASLEEILEGLHEDIRHLNISHTNMPVLRSNHFANSGLIHLEMLTLEFNGIITLEEGAFDGLPQLTDLHLQNNNISALRAGTFLNQTNLLGLNIARNKIKNFTFEVFLGLNNLGYLSLEHNEIDVLHKYTFDGLSNLRNLWLSANRITDLHPDTFRYTPKLTLLSLKDNNKLFIPTDLPFLYVSTIKQLLLSGCNIKSLSASSFEMSPNISYLDIENNSLATIEVETLKSLPQLRHLHLLGNPLECDCQLQRVWQWCQKYDITTGYSDKVPKCHGPEQVSGLWWGVLGQAQCSNGYIEYQGDYKSIVHKYVPYDAEYEHYIDFRKYIESSVYGVLFVIGAVGNIAVLIIITCNKRMRTVPNTYIFNLAVGDLLSLTMNLPLSHAMNMSTQWILGDSMCKLGMFVRELSIGVSGFSVAVLSIQRYYATSGSLHLSSRRATAITLLTVWFAACCCALPSVTSVHVVLNTMCSPFHDMEYYKMVLCFNLLVFCVIPLCVIVSMYVMTARNLARRANFSESEVRRCRNLAKIVIGLAVVFFVSFVPYHILITVLVWEDPTFQLFMGYMLFVSVCLLALNPCLNPISLCCTNVPFKKLFKHYLLCCWVSQEDENPDSSAFNEASVYYRQELTTEAVVML